MAGLFDNPGDAARAAAKPVPVKTLAAAVADQPGKTAAEIAGAMGVAVEAVEKGCSAAVKAGLVYRGPARTCETTTGNRPLKAVTWWPKA